MEDSDSSDEDHQVVVSTFAAASEALRNIESSIQLLSTKKKTTKGRFGSKTKKEISTLHTIIFNYNISTALNLYTQKLILKIDLEYQGPFSNEFTLRYMETDCLFVSMILLKTDTASIHLFVS